MQTQSIILTIFIVTNCLQILVILHLVNKVCDLFLELLLNHFPPLSPTSPLSSPTPPDNDVSFDEKEPTSYEIERMEREFEFDNRIEMLKNELAEQHVVAREGTIADELHPLVHNLPHDSLGVKNDTVPEVEVAE